MEALSTRLLGELASYSITKSCSGPEKISPRKEGES
jgi:hypothetical protein